MTTSINSVLAVSVGGLGTVLLMFTVGYLVMLLRFRAPVASWRDQFATAKYVLRYDNALDWRGIGTADRRILTNDLRRNIADAATEESLSGILERLGHPRDLASAVSARDRGPTWALGSAVALGVWFLLQIGAVIAVDAMITSVEQLAPSSGAVVVTTPLLLGYTLEVTTDTQGEVDVVSVATNAAMAIVPTLGFVLFSRPWRLVTRRTSRSDSAPSIAA
ncbi:hypothetical protein [Demequina aurantiaca]|uniref:hypothetical protein n=1 Tax=Demequina aurantiaca TaxID=676200 RepID=UPI003D33976F